MKFFKYYYFVAIFTAAVLYLQLSFFPGIRGCILREGIREPVVSSLNNCTASFHLLFLALFLALAAGLVWFGFRRFESVYKYLEKRNKEWVIVVVLTTLAILPYLSRGNVFLGDAMHFSGLTIYMKQAILSLSYPAWQFYWHMGSGVFAFYGWLYFLLSGIVNIFVGVDWTNKILFFALHVISALLAYKFVKIATKNSKMAIIAAVVYSLSFEHIARIMIGRSMTSLTYMLTPLLFIIFELRISKKLSQNRAIAFIAITTSLLFLNQQADSIFITGMQELINWSEAQKSDDKVEQATQELKEKGLME